MKIGKLYSLMYSIPMYNSETIDSDSFLFMLGREEELLILTIVEDQYGSIIKVLTKEGIICWSEFGLGEYSWKYYFKILK